VADEDFIDRIIEGFQSLRDRPHLDIVAAQFAAGEIAFVVDHRGIRTVFEDDSTEEPDPGIFG
jgi:hypothetical protein